MIGGPLKAVVDAQSQAALSTVEFIKAVGFLPTDPNDPGGADTAEPIYVSFRYPKEVEPYEPARPPTILSIDVTAQGDNYTSVPNVVIADPPTGGAKATGTAVVVGGKVTGVVLNNPGSGYTSEPSVQITGGGGAGATAKANFQGAVLAKPAKFQEMKLEVPILTMLPVPFIRVEETTIDFNAKINSMEEASTNSVFKVDSSLKYKYGAKIGGSVPIKAISLSGEVSSSVNFKVSASYQRNTSSGYKVDRTYSMNVHVRAVQDEMPAGLERLLGILEDSIQSQPVE
jgi:hypothetical protein